jgi:ketosteroid isomerase-like protein
MSSQEENVAAAEDGLGAFQRGDLEGFLAFLDPEVEIVSPPDLPNPVHTSGHEGYLQWVGRWLEAWESFDVEAETYEPIGERHVLIHVVQRGVGKGSGAKVEMPIVYMLELSGGRATRMHLYLDREQALQAAREAESG